MYVRNTGLNPQPGMCPDQSEPVTFLAYGMIQPTEPPGQDTVFNKYCPLIKLLHITNNQYIPLFFPQDMRAN